MCGRFAQTKALTALLSKYRFLAAHAQPVQPRYNIAPMQLAPVFCEDGMRMMRWGLVPHWAKEDSMGAKLINARGETVAEKPSFREAFKKRRCLVPATGFFEWKKVGGQKVPHYIRLADDTPFVFAGLWELWRGAEPARPLESFTIITTEANDLVRPIHDRMPVLLNPPDAARWLAPDTPLEMAQGLLKPYPAGEMEAYPVSAQVGSPAHDGPDCVVAVRPEVQGELF